MSRVAKQFYANLIDEIEYGGMASAESTATINQYYKKLRANRVQRRFYQYNWQRRVQPMLKLVRKMSKKKKPVRILDAGCGVGSESILWTMASPYAQVTAIDASAERVAAAQDRPIFYQRIADHRLKVKFINGNVFETLKNEKFDLIWTMEALSHIDPAEDFLEAAYNSLNPGGNLLVSDSHLLNPLMGWRIYKLRKEGVAERGSMEMATGETIPYAHERLFGIGQLQRMLKKTGFSKTKAQVSVFFPPVLGRTALTMAAAKTSDRVMNRVPLARNLGGIYTVSACKK